ncbi:HD domain-containing protein [Streptomyces axinellae]|uniref:5'-deoxynucleotidase n=1 Tax=Streptomyces axinellae TaxID=552788 RepID=A0ABN3PSH3_9ACTN
MTDSTNFPHPLFDFIAYTARLREVRRHNNATALRKESVAEHSWHLAMVSWVLHAEFERESGLSLDLTRMLKLCLMHDLVEIDAGDPSAWSTDPAGTVSPTDAADATGGPDAASAKAGATPDTTADTTAGATADAADKARLEDAVAHERFGALPAPLGPELLALWREYEDGETPEARLVRGIDRLNPALMRLLTGQGWGDVGADAAALDRLQLPRVTASETLTALYTEVREAAVTRGLLPRWPPPPPPPPAPASRVRPGASVRALLSGAGVQVPLSGAGIQVPLSGTGSGHPADLRGR